LGSRLAETPLFSHVRNRTVLQCVFDDTSLNNKGVSMMSSADLFTYHSEPHIVLRNRRPRLSARQRAEKLICRTVIVALIAVAGFAAAPVFLNHADETQLSVPVPAEAPETAATATGAPVRVIPIYHLEGESL
jgi:hypothetical protein